MKKKILVFGASNSINSINHNFAKYTASQIGDVEINEIRLNEYGMPIFSVDREKAEGYPQLAHDFVNKIKKSDGLVISFAEHNGNYTAAFKNISDWISRVELKTYLDKPTFLLSTSPGKGGAKSVLGVAEKEFKIRGANIIGTFSLPSFNSNFSEENGILDKELKKEYNNKLEQFKRNLKEFNAISIV